MLRWINPFNKSSTWPFVYKALVDIRRDLDHVKNTWDALKNNKNFSEEEILENSSNRFNVRSVKTTITVLEANLKKVKLENEEVTEKLAEIEIELKYLYKEKKQGVTMLNELEHIRELIDELEDLITEHRPELDSFPKKYIKK